MDTPAYFVLHFYDLYLKEFTQGKKVLLFIVVAALAFAGLLLDGRTEFYFSRGIIYIMRYFYALR